MTAVNDQRHNALERANYVRLSVAQVARDMNAGLLSLEEALEDPRAASMPVERLLRSQQRVGQRKAAAALKAADIRGNRRVNQITARQRRALILFFMRTDGWAR